MQKSSPLIIHTFRGAEEIRRQIFEPAHDKTYNKTCVTRKDSVQLIHPSSMAKVIVFFSSSDNLEFVEGTCDQRRL